MDAPTIGIGLVSVGWMGRLHSVALRRAAYHYPELPLRPAFVLAADPVTDRTRFAVQQLGYRDATPDWRAVVAHPEVEAVCIAAPNALHAEIGVAAAAHGKHFWIEKPAGRNADETATVAAAAEAAGVRTTVGFNYRHVPAVAHARELVRGGRLGRLTHVSARFLNDYATDPHAERTWRFRATRAGTGALGDLMSHVVDLLHHIVGPITEVCGVTSTVFPTRPAPADDAASHLAGAQAASRLADAHAGGPSAAGRAPGIAMLPVENEDYAAALIRFANGPVGTVEASRITVGPRCGLGFDLHGTEGAVSWDFERMGELRVCLGRAGPAHGYTTVHVGPGHGEYGRFQPGPAIAMSFDDLKVIEAALFLRSIATGAQLGPGVADALAAARVLDGIDAAARTRCWEPITSP